MRRSDGSGSQNHFPSGKDRMSPLVFDEFNPDGSIVFVQDDPSGVAEQGDVQILALSYRPQKGLGRAAAHSSTHRVLVQGESRLLFTVYVHMVVAHLDAGLDKGQAERCVVRSVLDS